DWISGTGTHRAEVAPHFAALFLQRQIKHNPLRGVTAEEVFAPCHCKCKTPCERAFADFWLCNQERISARATVYGHKPTCLLLWLVQQVTHASEPHSCGIGFRPVRRRGYESLQLRARSAGREPIANVTLFRQVRQFEESD